MSTRDTLAMDSLGQDARMLLRRRLELQNQLQAPPTELEEYARALSSMSVDMNAQYTVQLLTYGTRLKLAIIFWHFNDPDLIRGFLRSPINKKVWESLYADYLAYSQQTIPYLEFIQSFDFLLSPQLPKRLASPKSRGTGYNPPRTRLEQKVRFELPRR
ncbi:hypothetical protein N7539_008649 [Penicillium diatomitis]|uniref:Uncharacterized protein n=1 Tax=Penicillium diatomitis TaxID=2819901 RepID=A0A9W9WR00_9EURO|nr:uncharacterized protein N7539_008649 [Penicillium diatomitis]KAJ5472080.1 hypothetical protein N7539_008649 [Penicillium diatomitis]